MTITDVTDAVIGWLRADPHLVDLLGSARRIGDRLPAGDTRPFVAVTRAGGGPALVRGWVRDSRLTIDVFGSSSPQTGRIDAARAAEETRRAVEELTGQTTGGIVFAAVDVLGDLAYVPDITFPVARPRYVFQIRTVIHPVPSP